jgi:hypothetical protein
LHNSLSDDQFSIFTSWTTRRSLALKAAAGGGVLLMKKVRLPSIVQLNGVFIQFSPDYHKEQEILLIGPQRADKWWNQ